MATFVLASPAAPVARRRISRGFVALGFVLLVAIGVIVGGSMVMDGPSSGSPIDGIRLLFALGVGVIGVVALGIGLPILFFVIPPPEHTSSQPIVEHLVIDGGMLIHSRSGGVEETRQVALADVAGAEVLPSALRVDVKGGRPLIIGIHCPIDELREIARQILDVPRPPEVAGEPYRGGGRSPGLEPFRLRVLLGKWGFLLSETIQVQDGWIWHRHALRRTGIPFDEVTGIHVHPPVGRDPSWLVMLHRKGFRHPLPLGRGCARTAEQATALAGELRKRVPLFL